MRKKLLLFLGLATISAGFHCVQAQDTTPKVKVYNISTDLDSLFAGSAVYGVSANGEYAVGHGTDYSEMAFIWKQTDGTFQQIKGSFGDVACAYSVSNDGTVVGCFASDNNGEIKEGGLPYMVPGYWKDGVWTALPLACPIVQGKDGGLNGEARFISADGSVITGYINRPFERNFYDEEGNLTETRKVNLLCPAVWIDGELQRAFRNLPHGDDVQQGMWSMCPSSDDGTIMAGVYEHPTGSRAPVVWNNGEIRFLYGENDIDIWVDEYFFEGFMAAVSPNGKYAGGYWQPQGVGGQMYAILYDVEEDKVEQLDGWGSVTAILDDGTVFGTTGEMGSGLIRKHAYNGSLSGYLEVFCGNYEGGSLPGIIFGASTDGRVLGGWYPRVEGIGLMMAPSVVVIPEGADGVKKVEETVRSVIMLDNEIIAPRSEKIELYNAVGTLVGSTTNDRIAVDGLKGIVIAKTYYENSKVQTKKFVVK